MNTYSKPFGKPQHWSHTEPGPLHAAIEAYYYNRSMSETERQALIDYIAYYLGAPGFAQTQQLVELRARVIRTDAEISKLLADASQLDINPL